MGPKRHKKLGSWPPSTEQRRCECTYFLVAAERGGVGNAGKTGVGRSRSTGANHSPATVTLETFVERGRPEVGGEHQIEYTYR
jgi:hypothetical protein